MPVLVVKFPEDNKKKVSMSRFLSNYIKREFSVIINVENDKLPLIFEILNQNDCKVLIAQDQSIKVDFMTYFLLYSFNQTLKNVKKENPDIEGENYSIFEKHKLFDLLEKNAPLKKILNTFQKSSKNYLKLFEEDYIISKNQTLYFDWAYRVRVLFDSITISALDLNNKLNKLAESNELDKNFTFIYAIYSGNNNLGDIVKFIDLQDINELNELEELIKAQVIYKNPYRLSETGKLIINLIDEYVKKFTPYKFPSIKQELFNKIDDYTKQFINLLTTLCLLSIQNRKNLGLLKDFKEFQNIIFDPTQWNQ